jgi:hypothetical protein
VEHDGHRLMVPGTKTADPTQVKSCGRGQLV